MKILKLNLSREEDPTGQGRNRANLNKKIKVRLANAESEVKKLFNTIPRTAKTEKNLSLNQDTFTTYDYEASAEQQEQLESAILAIVTLWLLQGQSTNKPLGFYSDQNVEESYRAGTLEVIRDTNSDLVAISRLTGVSVAVLASLPTSVDVTTILFSQNYLDNILGYQNDLFYELKGLSSKTSSQVYERIISGIKGNKTPREIIKDISKRFDVANSSAKRIVNTEINKINNNSRTDAIDFINLNTNINAVGRHMSALLKTTREWHAARHEKLYTTKQQNRWWNSGGNGMNRINCYCSFRIVILDKENNIILEQ